MFLNISQREIYHIPKGYITAKQYYLPKANITKKSTPKGAF